MDYNRPISKMNIKITERDLNSSVNFASDVINSMKRLETNLGWSNIKVKTGTPSHGMFVSFAPEKEALKKGKDALIAIKATVQLMSSFCTRHNLNHHECTKLLSNYKMTNTPLHSSCIHLKRSCSQEEYLSMYRSIDGSCNHLFSAIKGESFTGYSRLLYPDYADGVHAPRRAVSKRPLPSPRLISTSLVKHTEELNNHLTLAVMQWGQFLEHDLSRTATAIMIHTGNTIECCSTEGSNLSPRYIHPFCSPISVPSNDKYYSSQGLDCMSYVRSIPALRPDCSFGPTDQVNQATHYLDGSQIYGSTFYKTSSLRSFIGGKLETSVINGKFYLPLSQNPTEDCHVSSKQTSCFKSGDSRVNFQPQLTAMHTLWFREHNRIAEELAILNKQWDDETLFDESRKIVIAEMQHITYNEWIKKVLAHKHVNKIENLNEHDEVTDPSVSNSFATAVMRALKSLYSGNIRLFEEDRLINVTINLHNYFNNPDIIQQPNMLDSLIRGLATQSSQKVDLHYPEDLINKLYTNGHFGFDVLSMDIQRGRDHGLPSYTHYRTLCGLPEANSFYDFFDVMSEEHIKALSKVYTNPKDVDLIIGGLMEKPEQNSLLGPTFSCIMADQFLRTKKGDRYFYTNDGQPKPFSTSQLSEVKKVTLARIFCDNSDHITMMQPDVFEKISLSNNLVSCDGDDIPRMSLIPWLDSRERYY